MLHAHTTMVNRACFSFVAALAMLHDGVVLEGKHTINAAVNLLLIVRQYASDSQGKSKGTAQQ